MKFRHLLHREMEEATSVHRAAFDGQLPWLSGRHTPAEDTFYFSERVFPQCQVWGADGRTGLIGIIAFRAGWIEQLYVLPPFQGAGIGTAVLESRKDSSEAFGSGRSNGTIAPEVFMKGAASSRSNRAMALATKNANPTSSTNGAPLTDVQKRDLRTRAGCLHLRRGRKAPRQSPSLSLRNRVVSVEWTIQEAILTRVQAALWTGSCRRPCSLVDGLWFFSPY